MQDIKKVTVKVPQAYLDFINQIFEIEKKANNLKEENSIQRNINKMKGIMEEEFFKGSSTIGLTYHNPLGEDYTDTRTDCEATISGTGVENLEIVEVIMEMQKCSPRKAKDILKLLTQDQIDSLLKSKSEMISRSRK